MGNKGVRDNLMKEGVEKIRSLLSWEAIVGDFENYLTERIKARGK
jgi:hypothetical protein